MRYKIAVLYDEKKAKEALETFEDLQSELTAWKIPYKTSNGKVKKVVTAQVEAAFLPYDQTATPKADLIYTTDRLRKLYKADNENDATKIICHQRPFQDLVNLVLDIKQRHEETQPTQLEMEISN